MRRLIPRYLFVPVLLALATAGCSDDLSTSPTDSTETPSTITDEFSGTIGINGAATHTFVVNQQGSVTATLVSLSPNDTIQVGFSMGTWNGATCQIVIARDLAAVGQTVIGSATSGGVLCLRVYDIGQLTEPTSYTLRAVHP